MLDRRRLTTIAALLLLSSGASAQQTDTQRAEWNVPVEPFTVLGNVHYVGAAGVSAFLITTSEGAILLDGGLPETAPQIKAGIEKLGFRLSDVKYLLNSHAHFDHAGGLAELKKLSGGSLVASAGDAPALKAGGPAMPAVAVDRIVNDGDTVRLANMTLTAHVTPGHTRGCTTWTTTVSDQGKPYKVVFYCSTSVVARLVGNTEYPGIVSDYEQTFRRLREFESDVFLANHPVFFGMADKRRRMSQGGPNPFVDPSEMRRHVSQSEEQFRAELAKQRTEPGR